MTHNARLLVRREKSRRTNAVSYSFTVEITESVNETVLVMILARRRDKWTLNRKGRRGSNLDGLNCANQKPKDSDNGGIFMG